MIIRNLIILSFILSIPAISFSQVVLEKESLEKNDYKLYCKIDDHLLTINEKDGKQTLSYHGYSDPSKAGELALPTFDIFIAIPHGTKPDVNLTPEEKVFYNAYPELNPAVSVFNSEVLYVTQNQLKKNSNSKLFINKGYLWIGENYCLHLSLNLFAPGQDAINISLIKKFVIQLKFNSEISETAAKDISTINPLILNKKSAQNYSSKRTLDSPKTDAWIDYNSEYLKIGVNKDGVYRINYDDIFSKGINISSIDPRTFKLIMKGTEIPIYIKDEGNGRFDLTDFIEFAGQRNMGGNYRETSKSGETYKEYVNRYSDTTIYWLTWNGSYGKRANSQQNNFGSVPDTLKYYSEIIHIENNNWFDFSMSDAVQREMPFWSENKTWNEGNLGVGTRTKVFSLKDIYPNKPVKVFTKLQDYASNIDQNAHLLAISLNNAAKQDSGYINRYQQKVLQGIYNSNILNSGNNSLNVFSIATNANPNLCIVDWYELEYPRYLKAINDSLNFQFPFLAGSSLKGIYLSNVTNSKNYSLWKVGKSIIRYNSKPANNSIVISDTLRNDDRFFLIDSAKTLRPKIYYKKVFVNLRNQSNSADYIAITHKKFIRNIFKYTTFISQSYNVKTRVIDVDNIYDEFAYGFFQPEAIRDFLITTHTNWQAPFPNYVFLIGGATYDYLGNKTKFQGVPLVVNYVPAFGSPVSDTWFVIWDTTGAYIPQMNIGRLPVSKNEELLWYMQKHQQYIKQNNSAWNKRYLFFSGGTGNDQNQIDILRNTNNYIINNYVIPQPIGGISTHFYKTINPTTNYGPYTTKQIQTVLDSGGVFISYLGHSGTQTWDNSITDPTQLRNKVDHFPLITDFGCSTAKFAEPDVVSFSQLFVESPAGQAIAYIGNSSLGFTSTSFTFPQIFYKKILVDSVYTIGEAHHLAKLDLINNFGSASVYKLFCLTNTLIGDPIVKLPIPAKPNIAVTPDGIKYQTNSIIESDDSLKVFIKYFNYGKVEKDTFTIAINSSYNKIRTFQKLIRKQIPMFIDSLIVSVPIKNQPGQHSIQIILDNDNRLSELSKNDNTVETNFFVSSSSIKIMQRYSVESKLANPITLINPVSNPFSGSFLLEVSTNKYFSDIYNLQVNFDTVKTKVTLPDRFINKRMWLRSRINSSSNYNDALPFISGQINSYNLSDSLGFSTVEKKDLKQVGRELILDDKIIHIDVLSAGFNDGNTALIQINDQNLIPENTLGGHHIVLLEDSTYKFVQYKRFFILGDQSAVQNYIIFLDTLSSKYLVVFAVSDEGSVSSTTLRDKLKLFGSKFIDNLSFRGSWAMIGKKGAKKGSVPESYSQAFNGRIQVDTTIVTRFSSGSFTTSKIGPSSNWKNLTLIDSIPSGSSLNYRLLGMINEDSVDTLTNLQLENRVANLSSIDAKKYPYIKIKCDFTAPIKVTSPVIKSIEVTYKNPAELATNYQVVSTPKDSVEQGENINISFYVYNVGESRAENFKVNVELIKKDNSHEKIFETTVDSLGAGQKKLFNVLYNTANISGSIQLNINIDPENKILELYKDNNLYSVSVCVKPNTMPASVKLTFDGNDIINGDFVSANPNIRIELNDQSLVPITDTTAVQMFLNNKRIYFINNLNLNYSFSVSNPKFVVYYKPTLESGSYIFKVIGKNATGQVIDSAGVTRKFEVQKDLQLLDVYNYPNPFKDETFFTFKLTQLPDELKIKIFTLVGRMVKEFNLTSAELKYDFNKIYWDGRDTDGDLVANGVYLYKIISKKGSELVQTIQKLAVVR